jgi:recombination endonuclease VII
VATEKVHKCKDCRALPVRPEEPEDGIEYRPRTPRPAPYVGPRCKTHDLIRCAAVKKQTHDNRVVRVYGLSSGDYDRLYAIQGGKCYICQRATGASKRLAVDHNHVTGEVRGLLCKSCNKDVLGHLRHDIEALQRAIDYLVNPPARRLLAASA